MIKVSLTNENQAILNSIDYSYINSLDVINHLTNLSDSFVFDLINDISYLKKFRNLIVFGIGGSCLGGKLLSSFSEDENKLLRFYDTIDEKILIPELNSLNLKNTAVLIISKSGKTLETVIQYELIYNLYKEKIVNFENNFFFITEKDSFLFEVAKNIKAKVFNFPKEIGGRYSCFTEASLIPSLFNNTDINLYIKGAKKCLEDFNLKKLDKSIQSSINAIKELDQFVLISYSEKLKLFNDWYVQLLAESSGKEGKGITPITAIGTRDQHSSLQLFLDGKNDKFFTIITQTSNDKYKLNKINNDEFSYLSNVSLSELLYTNAIATFNALKIKNRNVRLIEIENVNSASIGYLNCYFIIENILICKALNVNPFDQPAVEIIKKEVKQILSNKI